LGLDEDTFSQCLDSGKYTDIVQQEKQMAQQLGVQLSSMAGLWLGHSHLKAFSR